VAARPGISLKLAGKALGGTRELCTTTHALMNGLDEFFQQHVISAPEFRAGKIPLVGSPGSTAITRGSGASKATTYKPSLVLRGWVDRPADLGPPTISLPGTDAAPASNGAIHHPVIRPEAAAQPKATPLQNDEMPF